MYLKGSFPYQVQNFYLQIDKMMRNDMKSIDFKAEVLDKSYEKPVVVDFWAAWCGPCRILGPVIEQIAEEQQDRFTLVKLDTEANYEVAQEYRIMSIPNVKMFYQGEEIAEFVGALPRHQILKWLDENLPDERKNDLAELLANLDGSVDSLVNLDLFVAANPDVTEARMALAKHLSFTQPAKAIDLVKNIHLGDKFHDDAEDVRTLAELMSFENDGSPAARKLAAAQEAIGNRDWEAAIQLIIEATVADKNFCNDLPRRAAIALFRTWGSAHPLTQNYRWRFDMALY